MVGESKEHLKPRTSSTYRSDKQREREGEESRTDLLIQRLMKARQEREGGSGSAGGGRWHGGSMVMIVYTMMHW